LGKSISTVRLSNELVRSAQKLKLSEKRFLMMAVSKVTDENISGRIAVTAIEYAEFYGVSKTSAYNTIAEARDGIFGRFFILGDQDHQWFKSRTRDTKGYAEIVFHEAIAPHIHDLKSCYTQYYLRRAGNFKHVYSWRLFELLMQFRTTGKLVITLADFKEILEVPESYNRDFSAVRHKVINPSIKEIVASGLPVKLKTIKKGRAISTLEFTFKLEQQRDWVGKKPEGNPEQQPKRITKKYIEQNARPGESYSEAQERLQRELAKQQQEVQYQKSA